MFTWAAIAALAYPLAWFLLVDGTGRDFATVTQSLVTFMLLLVGTALAIHWAVRQPGKMRPLSVVAYALLCAWLVVTIAVAWTFWEERGSAEFVELLIISPLFFVIGAPGFAVVALAAWRERRRATRDRAGTRKRDATP